MQAILLYWFASQHQTTTPRPQNCHYFYVKFSAESNGLGLFSNKKSKWPKHGSNQISPENRQMPSFGGYGLRDKPRFNEESQNNVFSSFLDAFRLSNAKLSTRKAFVQGRLVS